MTTRTDRTYRGWDLIGLRSSALAVELVPAKGGDILSVRWLPGDVELLWRTPWGLRHSSAPAGAGDSVARLMECYPGGWQSVLPNGGDAVVEHGVEWGMHGEAWLTAFDVEPDGPAGVVLRARLVRSPLEIVRRVGVVDNRLSVTESVTNVGGHAVDVMWGHHPAFGAPFLSGDCRISTTATRFLADDIRTTASGDLVPGAEAEWPWCPGKSGAPVDLRVVPPPHAGIDRMGYLTGFPEQAEVCLTNTRLGLAATLRWNADVLPYAWYWLESDGTPGFPWYASQYVLAIEPASSHPAQGLAAVRAKTGTQLTLEPGETRTVHIGLTVEAGR